MSEYIDLLIAGNDLVLDLSRQPLLIDNRASIAQDIAHMIRDSGLLVTLVAERDRLKQRTAYSSWSCWWRPTSVWYRALRRSRSCSQASTWSRRQP